MADPTANELFFDAMIRHQIGLLRVSAKIQREIIELLDETEKDLADQITRRLKSNQSVTRQEQLLKYIRGLRNDAWIKSAKVWQEELLALAQKEPIFTANALRTVSPVTLDLLFPSPELLNAIVTAKPFQGAILSSWADDIAASDLRRIERGIKIGIAEGESSAEIASRVVGTVQQKGKDGLTEIARRNAAALTRTAVNHISNQARGAFFLANADLFSAEQWVAVLDDRTTPVCRARDGEQWPVGEGPYPPAHFNCRSTRVAIISGEALGTRPMRNFTQRQLLREFAAKHGIPVVSTRADLPHGFKGLFDQFARGRMRELTGTGPAVTTYQTWLKGQSATFQDDVLGVTRGKLFRRGGLTLDKFVDKAGAELTLAELARKEADAFIAAGLNPFDFY